MSAENCLKTGGHRPPLQPLQLGIHPFNLCRNKEDFIKKKKPKRLSTLGFF
jgi:hypothetical protein